MVVPYTAQKPGLMNSVCSMNLQVLVYIFNDKDLKEKY